MPIKMVASRRHYLKREERECEPGEVFEVDNERDARMLEKRKRATRHQEEAVAESEPTPAAPRRRRATLQTETVDPASSTSGVYARRDMRAED